MRRLFTTAEFLAAGKTERQLHWGVRTGKWVRAAHGVYADGPEPPDALTRAVARVKAAESFAAGLLAGTLLRLDNIEQPIYKPRRGLLVAGPNILVDGVPCTNGLQTIIDLAAMVDDLVWEHALESALHKKLFTLDQLEALLPQLTGTSGVGRIRRVLALRPPGAPPTESLLETLALQIARATVGIPEPQRQVVVENEYGDFVARVDFAWPDLGAFWELDGEGHKAQQVYDAARESAVVAATGWLCIRSTWRAVRRTPKATGRKLARVIDQARRRPMTLTSLRVPPSRTR